MSGTDTVRLAGCFRLLFPGTNDEAIASISQETVPEWDSVTQITLLSLAEEEFGIRIDPSEYEWVRSFDSLLQLVRSKLHDSQIE